MKQALLIGINYRGLDVELRGCINDVHNIKKYLLTQGYSEENIVILTDDTPIKPTRANIISALHKLIKCGETCESLMLHYSGHGSWIADKDGDESDGRDETLVPLDYLESDMIIDDELRSIVSKLNSNCKLFVIFDCCHSGTGLDLRYNLKCLGDWMFLMQKNKQYASTDAKIVLLSGCRDDQTSADAYEEKQSQGALTYAFLKIMKNSTEIRYQDLLNKIRSLLNSKKYNQVPQLSFGKYCSSKSKLQL